MADWRPRLSLTAWTLATLDVSLFVLFGVVTSHVNGVLAALLSGLHTLAGIAVFCYLWALFVAAVRWTLATASLTETRLRTLLSRGVASGAGVGPVFLASVTAVAIARSPPVSVTQPWSLLLLALLATAIAALIGGLVGLLAGLLDVAIYRTAGAVLPESASNR